MEFTVHSRKKDQTGKPIRKHLHDVEDEDFDASAPLSVFVNMSQLAADYCLSPLEGKYFSQMLFLVLASRETHDPDLRD